MKEQKIREEVKEIFTNFLKKNKNRQTPERFAILDYIYSQKGHWHFNAETLFTDMQDRYRVSLATIYNTLDLLEEVNLIVKHQFTGQAAHYERIFGATKHNHLVCTQCGQVTEFSDKKIRGVIQEKTFNNFDITHYSLYVYGTCNKCIKENKKNND